MFSIPSYVEDHSQTRADRAVVRDQVPGSVMPVVLVESGAEIEREMVVQVPLVVQEQRGGLEVRSGRELEDRAIPDGGPGVEAWEVLGPDHVSTTDVELVLTGGLEVVRYSGLGVILSAENNVVRAKACGIEKVCRLGDPRGVVALLIVVADPAEHRCVRECQSVQVVEEASADARGVIASRTLEGEILVGPLTFQQEVAAHDPIDGQGHQCVRQASLV